MCKLIGKKNTPNKNKNKEVYEVNTIANEFNNFFAKIGPKIATEINKPLNIVQSYLKFNALMNLTTFSLKLVQRWPQK